MPSESHNLFTHFEKQFSAQGDKRALTSAAGDGYSFADLDAESARLARYLRDLGIGPGERISVQAEKSPEALCLYLACLRAGIAYHPLNSGYRAKELRYFFENAEPALAVCDPADLGTAERLAAETGVARVRTLDAAGGGSLWSESREASADFGVEAVEADDMAALLYSSGTTGVPKGVMLSHGNLLSNTQTLVEAWGFTQRDRLLHALPIFHVHGLFVATGCALLSGASMRWLAKFSAAEAIRFLPESTVMMGVPTYYTRLLAERSFTKEVCAGMRLFTSGSAPLLADTFAEFEARTGHRILERYGMTETGMNSSNPLEGERKPGTVGPPLPGVELRVVDADGSPLPPHEPGDLEVRGPNVFRGYWRMPEKTAEEFTADGFLRTGDKATIDDEGYVSIVGRGKDMVITGGLNVYPKEVELVIDDLPGVKESAVVGAPHRDFGEAVVAAVVATPGAQLDESSLIAAVKERLAAFKCPKRILFVDELPRNTMAKVQKNVLRDRCKGLFAD